MEGRDNVRRRAFGYLEKTLLALFRRSPLLCARGRNVSTENFTSFFDFVRSAGRNTAETMERKEKCQGESFGVGSIDLFANARDRCRIAKIYWNLSSSFSRFLFLSLILLNTDGDILLSPADSYSILLLDSLSFSFQMEWIEWIARMFLLNFLNVFKWQSCKIDCEINDIYNIFRNRTKQMGEGGIKSKWNNYMRNEAMIWTNYSSSKNLKWLKIISPLRLFFII